jgi:thiamine transport system substrate-binding protein
VGSGGNFRLFIIFVIVIGLAIAADYYRLKVAEKSQGKELVVYTYSSFSNAWGPGPQLKENFEKQCACKLRFVDVDDARLLLQRLEFEKDKSRADLILGLDQATLNEAKKLTSWHTISVSPVKWHPELPLKPEAGAEFIPYDWAPMAFVYRKGEIRPPKSLKDLLDQRFQKTISVIDPRTSTPGFQFLSWIVKTKGIDTAFEYLQGLEPNFFTVSNSWSSAYGLFKKKQAKIVFSYLTSPVYHWIEENDRSYQAVVLDEPYPYQVEYVAIPAAAKNKELATQFVKFVLLKEQQSIIMQKNYMLPVVSGVVDGTEFADLPKVQLQDSAQDFEVKELLDRWQRFLQ